MDWPRRSAKLDEKVEGTLTGYRASARQSRYLHQALSLIVIVGAVLAPVLTSLAAKPGAGSAPQVAAAVVGLAIAISEGLRRLLRPESRWKTTAIAVQKIVSAREAYRDRIVGHELGSDEWKAAYQDFRSQFETILMKETVEFFPDDPDQGRGPKG
ncbi:MAG: hypothetical protein DI537_10295 [Stutzerimonas stutzeri]|nr:MAG: hypothetical protein DI537_10295 [Stutzerimonas stutzeri]